jgi:plastocyanin
VFSYATKVLMALCGSALVGAAVFYAAVGGRAGAVLMLFLSLAALLAMLTVIAAGVRDIAPFVPADAPPPEPRASTPGAPATGSGWPLFSAAAVTLLAEGAATESVVLISGLIAVGLAALGWFSKAWSDHPTWTPRVSHRITDRFVAPVGLPVGGFLLAALIAVSFSRILLASSEKVAPLVALVGAVLVLGACAWVASRPRLASSALIALSALAGVSLVGAGIAGATQGERPFEKHEKVEPAEITAKGTNFLEKQVQVPSTGDVTIRFTNDDAGTYHNVAVYKGDGAEAEVVFNGEGFPGIRRKTYAFKAPAAGTYQFRCDFHANMVGTLIVGGS